MTFYNMKQCIYIITEAFFNERDKERYGVNFFLAKGHRVVVIDATNYFYKTLTVTYENYKADNDLVVHTCNSYKSIKAVMPKGGSGIAFLFIGSDYKSIRIRKLCHINKIRFGVVEAGFVPDTLHMNTPKRNIVKKFYLGLKKYGIFRTMVIVLEHICANISHDVEGDFLFTTDKDKPLSRIGLALPNSINIINSRDYDVYLDVKKMPRLKPDKYIVFIDQNMLNCKDFLRMGINFGLDSSTYFDELNGYFNYVEHEHNCKVVIAAHPKSDVNVVRGEYSGREVFINETALLIRDCEFVINYYSTAISFAVLDRKPIFFITLNDFKNTIVEDFTEGLSKSLGNSTLNISNDDIKHDLIINYDRYSDYEVKYIKSIDTELRTMDLIYTKLSRLGFLN